MMDELKPIIEYQLVIITRLLWLSLNGTLTATTPALDIISARGRGHSTADGNGMGGIGSDMASIICQYIHQWPSSY